MNKYHAGELQAAWALAAGGVAPLSLTVQEPENQTAISLSVISRIALIVPPSSCRFQCACDVQPVLVAFDASGNVISTLGSNDQPWQILASIVGSSAGAGVIGSIANYTNGEAQFKVFGITATGTYQIQFAFITPYGVSK